MTPQYTSVVDLSWKDLYLGPDNLMVAIHFFGMDSQPVSLPLTKKQFSPRDIFLCVLLQYLKLPLSSFSMTPSQADQLGELGQVDIFMAVCGKSFIVDLDVAKTPGSQMLSVEWPKELFYYALLRGPSNGDGKVSKAGWPVENNY